MSTTDSIQYFDIPTFPFQNGTTLPSARLAYKDINPHAPKTALIPTCFRGRIATTQTFASGALKNHRIIVVALFGNGESSSPSNIPGFPASIDYCDCVRAQHALLSEKLGVKELDVVVGFSMGGQTAYHWSAMYPSFVRRAVIICSSARTSAHNYQFLEGPRAALEHAVDYTPESRSVRSERTTRGVQAFGKAYSAWLTSAEWFDRELWTASGFKTLAEWDDAVTDVGYRDWAADDLLVMLRMWQRGDVAACAAGGKESLEAVLKGIKARILLLPCRTDQYFRPAASEREAGSLQNAEVDVIPSFWGHIAGGGANAEDTAWIDRRIGRFLDG